MNNAITAATGLLVLSSTAFGIDMSMQYVQSNNGFLIPSSETSVETSAIERTIFGGGEITGSETDALFWEVTFHEYLAFDYKSTSQATFSGELSYAWQNTLDPVTPWFETGIEVATMFGGNSQLGGFSWMAYLQKDRYWTDLISTSASGFIKQTYINEEELSGLNVGSSGSIFYDVSSRSTVYINSTLEMGRQIFSFTDEMQMAPEMASRSISNSQLSEELSQNWFVANVDGLSIDSFFGLNSRLREDLALDVAYNYTYVLGADYESSQSRFYASFYVEF